MNEYWKTTAWPTLEITTSIPKAGCVVDCVFCPQRVLQKVWNSEHFTTDKERTLSLDNFKMVIDKLPKEVRITMSGFTEPWLNKHCTDMLLYAHEQGHRVSVFTTAVGMSLKDVERIKDIPFCGGPNGGFTLHLPDKEYRAKHPVNKKYIAVCEALKNANIQNFATMAMGTVHPEVEHLYPDEEVNKYEMWHRAGNLLGEAQLKPEVKEVWNEFKSILHDTEKTCGCIEGLYHNILLPNGEVSLCCMDYNLEEILGNLFTQEYDDILPEPNTTYDMCMRCENGIDKPCMVATEWEEEITLNPQGTSIDSDRPILIKEKTIDRLDYENYFVPEAMVQYLDDNRVPEHEIIDWVKNNFMHNEKRFIDIGAHVGTYTWTLAPYCKEVVAFEPTKRTYNFLCANVMLKNLSNKVTAHNVALGESTSRQIFYERSKDGGTNGFALEYHDGQWLGNNQDNYLMTVERLDSYSLNDIGFIKIDVEGHELQVLKGATETLKENNYPPILFESWPANNTTNTTLKDNLFQYLFELGYKIGGTPHPEIFIARKDK
jgi:FkbM family methyltransferase